MEEKNFISRAEHEEFKTRIEAEENRQNHRIDRLEDNYEKLTDLTLSVKELSVSLKGMQDQLSKQSQQLEAIEKEPADNWKKAVWIVLAALIGFAIHAALGI